MSIEEALEGLDFRAFLSVRLDQWLVEKPAKSFTFLSMFKWEPRKNWEGLLERLRSLSSLDVFTFHVK